jgi:hypothetical protein
VKGHHYFYDPKNPRAGGSQHIRNTIIKNLQTKSVVLPGMSGQSEVFTPQELGIGYVLLVSDEIPKKETITNPNAVPAEKAGVTGGELPKGGKKEEKVDPDNPPFFEAMRYDFTLQFTWQEKPIRTRMEEKLKKLEADRAAALAAPAGNTKAAPPTTPEPAPVPVKEATPAATAPAPMPAAPMPPAGGPAAPMGPAAAPPGGAVPAASPPEVPPAAKG